MGLVLKNNEIDSIYLGNNMLSALYLGDDLIWPTREPDLDLFAIPYQFNMFPNVLSRNIKVVCRCGDWDIININGPLTFSQTHGGSTECVRTDTIVTVTVDPSQITEDSTFTFTLHGVIDYVVSINYILCTPIMCADNLNNTNNIGDTMGNNIYLIDTHVREITDCNYNVNGLKSFCVRTDSIAFYNAPALGLRASFTDRIADYNGDLELIDLSIPTFDRLNMMTYDNETEGYPNLKTIRLRDTENVTIVANAFYGLKYLETLELGDMSNVTTQHPALWRYWFYNNPNLVNFKVEKLPDNDEMSTWNIKVCTNLSDESIQNIVNALPQRTGYSSLRTCVLGSSLMGRVTNAQRAAANDKGWNLSV